MNSTFWVQSFGSGITGPFTAEQIRHLALIGRVFPQSLITLDCDCETWVPAIDVPGLRFGEQDVVEATIVESEIEKDRDELVRSILVGLLAEYRGLRNDLLRRQSSDYAVASRVRQIHEENSIARERIFAIAETVAHPGSDQLNDPVFANFLQIVDSESYWKFLRKVNMARERHEFALKMAYRVIPWDELNNAKQPNRCACCGRSGDDVPNAFLGEIDLGHFSHPEMTWTETAKGFLSSPLAYVSHSIEVPVCWPCVKGERHYKKPEAVPTGGGSYGVRVHVKWLEAFQEINRNRSS